MFMLWNTLYLVNVYQIIIHDWVAMCEITKRRLRPSIAFRASGRILARPLLQRALNHRVDRIIGIVIDRYCLRACRRKRDVVQYFVMNFVGGLTTCAAAWPA